MRMPSIRTTPRRTNGTMLADIRFGPQTAIAARSNGRLVLLVHPLVAGNADHLEFLVELDVVLAILTFCIINFVNAGPLRFLLYLCRRNSPRLLRNRNWARERLSRCCAGRLLDLSRGLSADIPQNGGLEHLADRSLQ